MESEDTSDESSFSSHASEKDDPFLPYLIKMNNTMKYGNYLPNQIAEKTSVQKSNNKKICKARGKSKPRKWCEYCPFSTIYTCDFNRHIQKHGNANFSCSECNMPFLTQGHLNGHKESAHGIIESSGKRVWWTCEKCEYKTRHTSDISKHKRRHDAAVGSCTYCNRPFGHLGRLNGHMKRDHGDSEANIGSKENMSSVTKRNDMNTIVYIDGNQKGNTSSKVDKTVTKEQLSLGSRADINEEDSVNNTVECQKEEMFQTRVHQKQTKDSKKARKTKKRKKESKNLRKENHEAKENRKEIDDERGDDSNNVLLQENAMNNERRASRDDRSCESIENSPKMICVFCGFETLSYNELNQHLDEHDIVKFPDEDDWGNTNREIDIALDHVESRFSSDNSIGADHGMYSVLCAENSEGSLGGFADTFNQISSSISLVQEDENAEELMNNAENVYDLSVEGSTNVDAKESTDAHDMLSRCVAKIVSESKDEFLMKPFACARCFFKTGNLDYLRVHVEAHLFEMTRSRAEHFHR